MQLIAHLHWSAWCLACFAFLLRQLGMVGARTMYRDTKFMSHSPDLHGPCSTYEKSGRLGHKDSDRRLLHVERPPTFSGAVPLAFWRHLILADGGLVGAWGIVVACKEVMME